MATFEQVEQASGATGTSQMSADLKTLSKAFAPLASLRLTVVLFACAILIVLIGTLAQTEMDMWEVISTYFYRWLTWVPAALFFPPAWFPNLGEGAKRAFLGIACLLGTPVAAALIYRMSRPASLAKTLGVVVLALGLMTTFSVLAFGGFVFFGGAAIGAAMALNLLAAHAIRFRFQATGARLGFGLSLIAAGAVLTWIVIVSGHNREGFQAVPFFQEWENLWGAVKYGFGLSMAAAVAATIYYALQGHYKRIEFWIFVSILLPLVGLAGWLLLPGNEAYLGDAGMRILWQLIKAEIAALVLLAGCILAFKRRGGIVLIHAGILLLMFGQLFVAQYDVEEQMQIEEGQTINYAHDIRAVELAVIDRSLPEDDSVVAIPLTKNGLESQYLAAKKIQHEYLPFDIEIVDYFVNSDVSPQRSRNASAATKGKGLDYLAKKIEPGSGADSSGRVNQASAYIKLTERKSGDDLGTYLVSQVQLVGSDRNGKLEILNFDEPVEIEGKSHEVALRFQRDYKPYAITLVDVKKDDYQGTSMVKNYSSDILLFDKQRGVEGQSIHIWMNNPLRYAGETFYQSNWGVSLGKEVTTLSVVTNSGWMIPYVACMLVATGLLMHFALVLVRFLSRQPAATSGLDDATVTSTNKQGKKKRAAPPEDKGSPYVATIVASLIAVLVGTAYLSRAARTPRPGPGEMDLVAAGQIPVLYKGRVKPLDTLARNSLRAVSNKETFKDSNGDRQPAIRWLLDVVSNSEAAGQHKVFRIDNLNVLNTLGLKREPGNLYSVEQISPNIQEFDEQVNQAREIVKKSGAAQLSTDQKKLIELARRIETFMLLNESFSPPNLPPLPTFEEMQNDQATARQKTEAFRRSLQAFHQRMEQLEPPLAIPQPSGSDTAEVEWQPYSKAWALAFVDARLLGGKPSPPLNAMNSILVSYGQRDVEKFNAEVAKYQSYLAENSPKELDASAVAFESFFNHAAPFYYCAILYVLAFVLTAAGWLASPIGWSRPLIWAGFSLIALTFVVHTAALVARIYISGRPPVTNLYSSAVFIGWGCVVLGILLELIFRIGIGNVVAAVSGFSTLLIAHFLADGDTMAVLQAVLDTQFWLATHVVTVTLGYATTFVAGLLGIIYVVAGMFTPALNRRFSKVTLITDFFMVPLRFNNWTLGKILATMIYGVICFALFFSFVGTVLGGLWADDSWGRFWGWDPKENGALIIVLYNALVLHARWGGIVKERGLAVLAIVGNIVTSWSWFGVNELGVGLHSYGFTEGVLLTLGLFVLSQLTFIILGSIPPHMWWAGRNRPAN